MELQNFIASIEEDYLYLLYNKFKWVFPGCCHEASNILCGYINLFFDDTFVHRYVSGVPYPHSYISNKSGIIIDFTCFQYIYLKHDFENVTKKELLNMAQQCKYFPMSAQVFTGRATDEKLIDNNFRVIDIPCMYIEGENDIKHKYNKNTFIDYCENYADEIRNKVMNYIREIS